MTYYAVIDTNVLVSFFITKNTDSPIIQVVNAIRDNIIIPLFEESILEEYISYALKNDCHQPPSEAPKRAGDLVIRYASGLKPGNVFQISRI